MGQHRGDYGLLLKWSGEWLSCLTPAASLIQNGTLNPQTRPRIAKRDHHGDKEVPVQIRDLFVR
jgi:hypothetical protein